MAVGTLLGFALSLPFWAIVVSVSGPMVVAFSHFESAPLSTIPQEEPQKSLSQSLSTDGQEGGDSGIGSSKPQSTHMIHRQQTQSIENRLPRQGQVPKMPLRVLGLTLPIMKSNTSSAITYPKTKNTNTAQYSNETNEPNQTKAHQIRPTMISVGLFKYTPVFCLNFTKVYFSLKSAWNKASHNQRLSVLAYVGVLIFAILASFSNLNQTIGVGACFGILFGAILYLNRASTSQEDRQERPRQNSEQTERGNRCH